MRKFPCCVVDFVVAMIVLYYLVQLDKKTTVRCLHSLRGSDTVRVGLDEATDLGLDDSLFCALIFVPFTRQILKCVGSRSSVKAKTCLLLSPAFDATVE